MGLDAIDPADAAGDPDADGVSSLDEDRNGTHPVGLQKRYFAEGATGPFFGTTLALVNPGPSPAHTLVRFLTESGTTSSAQFSVPPFTRQTLDASQVSGLESASFSTVIESDVEVVADRTMHWTAEGYGSHAETALAAPSSTRYLAEGSTSMTPIGDFALFYLLQNPEPEPVDATIRFLRSSGLPPIERTYRLAPASRTTIQVDGVAPQLALTDVSAVVTASRPIIVERAMYLDRPGETFVAGHGSAGVTVSATAVVPRRGQHRSVLRAVHSARQSERQRCRRAHRLSAAEW